MNEPILRGDPELGATIMLERRRRKLSQTQLSRLVCVSQHAISCYERGTKRVSPQMLILLKRVLGPLEAPA